MRVSAQAHRIRGFALFSLLFLFVAGGWAADTVRVTYLANEGFLIARGEQKVLLDALFPGIDNYPVPAAETVADIQSGEAPFDVRPRRPRA